MNANLFINDCFERQHKSYRLLEFELDQLYVIQFESSNPMPEKWHIDRLKPGGRKEDAISLLPQPTFDSSALNNAANIVVRDKRWGRIEALVGNTRVLDPATRSEAIANRAQNIGVSAKTILADLRRWWLGGQTKDALLGGYDKCGRILDSTKGIHKVKLSGRRGESVTIFAPTSSIARGRRPTYGNHLPFSISQALRTKLIQIAKTYYQQDETISVRALAEKVLSDMFCVLDEKGVPLRTHHGKRAVLRPQGQRPSTDQLRRIVEKALAISQSRARRTSPHEFENNHAPTTSSVKDDCLGPGDVYEIDATFIDLWIVAMANATKIIGKATLYLVIDRDSRLIVGFYISLENPSWCEAKGAVLSIGGDWEAICRKLGVRFDPEDWPAQGVLANRFVGDRAEMLAYSSNILCDGLDVSVTNPPARRGNRKPIVESGFKTTHVTLKDIAPGYEPPKNPRSRSGVHYDKDACLNLDQLAKIFLEIVIKHNNSPKPGYLSSPEEVFGEFQPTPIAIWNRGTRNRMGLGRRYDYGYLRAKLAPTGIAQVHVDGIRFKGCIYEFDEAHDRDWMTRASIHGSFPVGVIYTESLVDNITISDPKDKHKTYLGALTPKARHFSGYSFAEVHAYRRLLAKITFEGKVIAEEIGVATRQKVEAVTTPAHKAMKADTKGLQLGTRHRDADQSRSEEARARRRQTHDPVGDGIPYFQADQPNSGASSKAPTEQAVNVGLAHAKATKVVNLDSVRKSPEGSKTTSGSAAQTAIQPPSEPAPSSRSLQSSHPNFANHLLDLLK